MNTKSYKFAFWSVSIVLQVLYWGFLGTTLLPYMMEYLHYLTWIPLLLLSFAGSYVVWPLALLLVFSWSDAA